MPRILVVDDERNIAELARMIFTRKGYDAVSVTSFDAAKASLADTIPDVVLTDVEPYGKAVLTEVNRLRENDPRYAGVESFVMSGRDREYPAVQEALGLSTTKTFFGKPFNFSELVSKVTEYVGVKK
ncbi:MAG: response regulator [Nanoarchaeota archaeon]|nr:response regulator [Nanoarchaeota archaeon]